jgi:hypothetical protein
MRETRSISIQIKHEQEGRYFTVPFDLPEHVDCLRISYRYERLQQSSDGEWTIQQKTNAVDLALIDPMGRLAGSSGTNRDYVEICGTSATPGYRPEPVMPGTWAILVGAYHIAPEGVTVDYEIIWDLKERRWYTGDLHTHTLASDGVLAMDELAVHARRHGLDFVAITDHNTAVPADSMPQIDGLTLIPGLEWTHYKGHANMLGTDAPYRGSYHAETFEDVLDLFRQARNNGALIVINHPCDPPYRFHFKIEDLPHDLIEVWNGPMRESNLQAIGLWQQMLADGRKIPACCGSDYHKDSLFQFLGGPCLRVLSWSQERVDLLNAVRHGHSYMVYGPDGPRLELKSGAAVVGDSVRWQPGSTIEIEAERLQPGDEVRMIGKKGVIETWHVAKPGKLNATRPVIEPGFVRIEIHRRFIPGLPVFPGLLSNPIFFD